jgi:ABC-type dipeptide/oligopeptide/nickel transport system permease component
MLASVSLLGQGSTVSQAATTSFTTTFISTSFTTTVSTFTSTSTHVIPVSIVGNVTVEKVVTQFDVTSLIVGVLATIVAAVLGTGVGVFIQSRRDSGLLVQGNAVYCRKHGVLVTITPAGLYCPIHKKVIA